MWIEQNTDPCVRENSSCLRAFVKLELEFLWFQNNLQPSDSNWDIGSTDFGLARHIIAWTNSLQSLSLPLPFFLCLCLFLYLYSHIGISRWMGGLIERKEGKKGRRERRKEKKEGRQERKERKKEEGREGGREEKEKKNLQTWRLHPETMARLLCKSPLTEIPLKPLLVPDIMICPLTKGPEVPAASEVESLFCHAGYSGFWLAVCFPWKTGTDPLIGGA